jgi:hypothetical protein
VVALVAIFSYAPSSDTTASGAVSGAAETQPSPAVDSSNGLEATADEPDNGEVGEEPSAEQVQASASAAPSASGSASTAPSVTAPPVAPRPPRPPRPVIRSKGPDPETMFGHR